MNKKIIIDANFPNETRVAMLNSVNNIEIIEYETASKQQLKSNIYLAKITRVEPSLQAAFVDYGNEKAGFLPFSEIHPVYFHIPVSDQKDSLDHLKEIKPPKITSDDLAEGAKKPSYKNAILDDAEIDLNVIEKLIDEKNQPDFDLEASEIDIEPVGPSRSEANYNKHYKIQEVIKKGQVVLVQVTKEERGNKGVSLTTYLSLAGKYCVLMPNKPSQNGISRKISSNEERKRLKDVITELSPDDSSASVIARTAAIGHSTLEIKRDYEYLVRLWNKIREATLNSIAPCFIHQEDGIIQKTIRDIFDHNVKELLVQGREAFQMAQKFMKDILPTEMARVKEYKGRTPIFTKFDIENQLSSLYQPNVPLPSGGYIVINPTEAMISIDVNSGKATSERNIEETALKTNLEAAKEIARQAKLRDLSGLLVIDFIDMSEGRNRKIVERSMKEFFARDKARIQIAGISAFGLLEMSRQRLHPSFLETHSSMCMHCNGKGIVRADESNAMLILRTVENEIFSDDVDIVNVYANLATVIYLLNNKRSEIVFIENKYNIKLNFNFDPQATSDSYAIEKVKLPQNGSQNTLPAMPALQSTSEIYNEENADFSKGKRKWKAAAEQDTENKQIVPETKKARNEKEPKKPSKNTRNGADTRRRQESAVDSEVNGVSNENATQDEAFEILELEASGLQDQDSNRQERNNYKGGRGSIRKSRLENQTTKGQSENIQKDEQKVMQNQPEFADELRDNNEESEGEIVKQKQKTPRRRINRKSKTMKRKSVDENTGANAGNNNMVATGNQE